MGQVHIMLNGRTYRLACADGQESRLQSLAEHVKSRVDRLAIEFGQVGEERLLLMAALLVTDELFDVRERITEVAADPAISADPDANRIAPTEVASQLAPSSVPAKSAKQSGKATQANAAVRKSGHS